METSNKEIKNITESIPEGDTQNEEFIQEIHVGDDQVERFD